MSRKKAFYMSNNLEKNIEACSLIQSDKERLACYDKLATFICITDTTVNETKWTIDKNISPIDDSPIIILTLSSDESTSPRGFSFLCIRYQDEVTEVFISWDEFIDSDDRHVILIRFDKEDHEKMLWNASANGTASFYHGNSIDFIKKIAKHDKLFARVTHYNGETTSAIFDIKGLSDVIKPICEVGGWSLISKK